jgi:hypothetical protein
MEHLTNAIVLADKYKYHCNDGLTTCTKAFCLEQLNHLINTEQRESPTLLATLSIVLQEGFYVKKNATQLLKAGSAGCSPWRICFLSDEENICAVCYRDILLLLSQPNSLFP